VVWRGDIQQLKEALMTDLVFSPSMLAAAPSYKPSEAEVEAAYRVILHWAFPADGSHVDMARAALIAADKARR